MRFPEIWTDQPLGSREGVEEELLGRVVLIDRLAIVLAHEREQAGPLVLPDGCLVITVNNDLVARTLATERRKKGFRLWVAH